MSFRVPRHFGFEAVLLPLAWAVELLVWHGETKLRSGGHAPLWLVPVCSAAVFATLSLRRRWPGWVLAVQLVWAAVGALAIPLYSSFPGVLIALYALASSRPPRRSVPGAIACALPMAIETFGRGRGLGEGAVGWLLSLLACEAAWGMGFRVRKAELRRKADTFDALRTERLRIARELHDILAHSVSVMVVQAAGARAVLETEPQRAASALDVIQDIGMQSGQELRRLFGLLRSAGDVRAEGDLERQPGLDDIDVVLENAHSAGLTVTKRIVGTPKRVDPSVALTAYRVVQEALTNTIKHGGADAVARVCLEWAHDELILTVKDQTPLHRRPDTSRALSTGYGLLGLGERVATVGGRFDARPVDGGFRVQAVLPASGSASPTDGPSDAARSAT